MVAPRSSLTQLALALWLAYRTANAAHRSSEDSNLLQYASTSSSTPSSLSVIDITLDAPTRSITCGATLVEWNWDLDGAYPDDPISLSIINATDLSTLRRRASNRHVDYHSNVAIRKRAANGAVLIQGATSIPFSQGSFQWDEIRVPPGQYRLLLTTIETDDSVVSDPFEVSPGYTDSCLRRNATGSTTTSPSVSTSSTHSSDGDNSTATSGGDTGDEDEGDSDSATSSSVIPVPSDTATNSSISGGSQGSTGSLSSSSRQGENSTNTGALVAGVLVPLLFIIGGAIAYLWRRRRRSTSDTTEKTTGEDSEDKWYRRILVCRPSNGANAQHRRQISGPEMATAAGLASVAKLVPAVLRTEKDEAALKWAGATDDRRPRSRRDTADSDEHWADFGADDAHNVDGARPLSPNTIDSRTFSVIGGNQQLYAQGENIHLSSQWSSESSQARDSASSGPSRSSIATFSTVSNNVAGRDLLASLPLTRSTSKTGISNSISPASASSTSSSSTSSPFGDEHAATVPEIAASATDTEATAVHQRSDSQGTTKLERSDSGNSQFGIKRKPVPRFSGSHRSIGTKLQEQSTPAEADPFSNSNAIPGSHNSIEILKTPKEGPTAPSTPPRPPFKFHAATPSSIPETAFSDTMSISSWHTPDLRASQSEDSLATLPSNSRPSVRAEEGGEQNLYHLSINLGSEGGFRMSFN